MVKVVEVNVVRGEWTNQMRSVVWKCVCVNKRWCDAKGEKWKRGRVTVARDQVELCKVMTGERERKRGVREGSGEVEWLKGLRS